MDTRMRCILTLLVGVLVLGAAAPASVAAPMPSTSTYHVKLGPRTVEPMGDTVFRLVNETNQATSTGTFASQPDGITFQVRAVVNWDTGEGIFQSMATFNGTVAGRSGTATLGFVGTITDFTTFQGDWIVLAGTGGLATLKGQGTFLQSGGPGSFHGLIDFD